MMIELVVSSSITYSNSIQSIFLWYLLIPFKKLCFFINVKKKTVHNVGHFSSTQYPVNLRAAYPIPAPSGAHG